MVLLDGYIALSCSAGSCFVEDIYILFLAFTSKNTRPKSSKLHSNYSKNIPYIWSHSL